VFCCGDELQGEDGIMRGERELELGSLFVEFAESGDGLGDVGAFGPGGDLAERHVVIAADRGEGVVGGEPEEEELVVVGGEAGRRREGREGLGGGAHACSLACVWMEARRKMGWSL
jgi:hypothetical protein